MKKLSEHQEQSIVFGWSVQHMDRIPELRWLFAIPNGARVPIGLAVKLKKEGLRKGVSDIFLPVARGGYHGIFIEMKAIGGRPSPQQHEFTDFANKQGYKAIFCYGHKAAIDQITKYMELKDE